MIAMELLHCEQTRPFTIQKNDWIRFIIHQLTIGCSTPTDLLMNKIKFVTFNYELSLELRIHEALNGMEWFARDGLPESFLGHDRILHVYGALRTLEESHKAISKSEPSKFSDNIVGLFDVSSSNERQSMKTMANGIDIAFQASRNLRTIAPSDKATGPSLRNAIDAIAQANYLYIFGFGFDRENCRIINLGRKIPGRGRQFVYFTNLNNQNKINKQFAEIFSLQSQTLSGDNFQAADAEANFICEKSTRNVYDALAYDLDLIG
jgi:hypothetical protein